MCSGDMNETILRGRIDFLKENKFLDLGYDYFNLDDCFIAPGAAGRNASGILQPDPATFPSGMAALADYAHSNGFKFGVCELSSNSSSNLCQLLAHYTAS